MRDLTQLAINLAQNCGYPVFPCEGEKKRPAWGKHEGGNGFHDASTDPMEIARLFQHHRAELIGIATGEVSGISVLDVDVKHDTARAWFHKYQRHIPATRTYRTRGGGLHFYFEHRDGVRNSEAKPVKGIDARGTGGYVIFWFAAGFECLDHSPPAAWPEWLSKTIWPPPVRQASKVIGAEQIDDQLERIRKTAIQKVSTAGSGNLHSTIRAAARLLGGVQGRAGFSDTDATRWLMDAAGLQDERKAANTIAWALAKGRREPLDIRGR